MNEKIKYIVLILLLLGGLSIAAVDPARVDLDGDLTIDTGDLLIFSPAWLAHGGPSDDWNPACDISNPPDGIIDMLDLDVLTRDWLVTFPNPADFVNTADINDDLKIDYHDYMLFSAAWLADDASDNWNPACDISDPADGIIDVNDLMVLTDNWLVRIPTLGHWHYGPDINRNLKVDLFDVSTFSAAWLSNDSPSANWNIDCDMALPRDGRVDMRDLAVLTDQWLDILVDPNDISDIADINDDYVVNLADYAIMAASWMSDDQPMLNWNWRCDLADPNDDRIDAQDFQWLAKYWQFNLPDPDLFAFVGGGEFEMGDHTNTLHASSRPVHAVELDSFYMGRTEVTCQQYCDFLNSSILSGHIKVDENEGENKGKVYLADDTDNSHPLIRTYNPPYEQNNQIVYVGGVFSVRIKDETIDMTDHPVFVNWYGAAAYCNWKSEQEGRTPCYELTTWDCDHNAGGYRLGTEAEWEYAARGGLEGKRYPWGDTIDGTMANYDDSGDPFEDPLRVHPYTTPVGYYDGNQTPAGIDMANGYGLYDVAGNVFEWCQDWYSSSYYNECDDLGVVVNPIGPDIGILRVLRGGSWNTPIKNSNVAYRDDKHAPDNFSGSYGFRICLPAP